MGLLAFGSELDKPAVVCQPFIAPTNGQPAALYLKCGKEEWVVVGVEFQYKEPGAGSRDVYFWPRPAEHTGQQSFVGGNKVLQGARCLEPLMVPHFIVVRKEIQ